MRPTKVSPLSGRTISQQSLTNGAQIQAGTQANVDSSGGAVTLLAPVALWPTLELGAFMVYDAGGEAATNPITIDGNGRTIDGAVSYELTVSGATVLFLYDQDSNEWKKAILPRSDPNAVLPFFLVEDLRAFVRASTQIGTYAARPNAGNEGSRYLATDSLAEWIDDGTEWRPLVASGSSLGYEPPLANTFTTYSNLGIAGAQTPTKINGTLNATFNNYNNVPEELRTSVRNMPAGPLTLTVFVRPILSISGTLLVGIGFRDSSTGAVEQLLLEMSSVSTSSGTFRFVRHRATANNLSTGPTFSFNSQVANSTPTFNTGIGGVAGVWLRITDDRAGNRGFWFSLDNLNWFELIDLRVTGGGFLTPDQVGIASWVSNAAPGGGNVGGLFYSYKES
jgi:hypothetical protein